jgi:RHS repeat-associated protein
MTVRFGMPSCMREIVVCSSRYTGKERDSESGLDYFGARYYASNMGRWMSPDWASKPEAVPYSDLENPQSLNLYGYEGNNPLSKADKDGHCWPLCTIIAGATVGAVTGAGIEAATEYFSTGKVDLTKVGNAALGGLVTGAIVGAAGPEAGVLAKAAIGAVAGVTGGAVERGVNGEKIGDAKAIAVDAVAGAVSPKVEAVADKTFATEAIAKTVPKAIDATVDAGKRLSSGGGEQPKPQTQPQPQQKTCTAGANGCN